MAQIPDAEEVLVVSLSVVNSDGIELPGLRARDTPNLRQVSIDGVLAADRWRRGSILHLLFLFSQLLLSVVLHHSSDGVSKPRLRDSPLALFGALW